MKTRAHYIRWFDDIALSDVALVGGKNAALGELYHELTPLGIRVPNGFAISAQAYRDALQAAGIVDDLRKVLNGIDQCDAVELASRAIEARKLVGDMALSTTLTTEILSAYHALCSGSGEQSGVAVRSSATAEDLPDASFAGQHDSFLNVRGDTALLDTCRRCFASIFTERAIVYRNNHGYDHLSVAMSVGVMKMVRSDLATSGVMFSLDTETGFPDVVLITAAYGLGENVVQGAVDPDEFYIHKPTYQQGYRAVLKRTRGEKKIKMLYADQRAGQSSTRNVNTTPAEQSRYCIDDPALFTLADYAMKIERHFGARAGRTTPMDMEWALDGLDGELYVVQARPETVMSQRAAMQLREYHLRGDGPLLVSGRAIGTKIAVGRACVIAGPAQLGKFKPGDVLVTDMTSPDWGPLMKMAAAIVTNRGGRTCHAAIVARELDVAAVTGTGSATSVIRDGDPITVSCAEGDVGRVYRGELAFDEKHTDLRALPRPATEIMINLADPDLAFKTSLLPNDGVGLAQIEFIISEHINIHPMALVHPEKIKDAAELEELNRRCAGYATPAAYFIERLAEGVGTIAAAFYPKPVIVRMSDFKSNEYANLFAGRWFEPVEENPMIGFRGASRYAHPDYADGFALECAAMKRVRETMGMTNIKLMIPFCRRVEEGAAVLAAMADHGLKRGDQGLEIYVMCEIPNNVLQLDAFAELFDGFSIGSNDLTQLTLGVDRDSEIVSFDFDERDPGVKELIRLAVDGARRNARHCGICGQAPSDYPEMAEYLVELGIDSMSLSPDTVLDTTLKVVEVERRLGRTSTCAPR